jgi:hypothetical protein
MPGSLRRQFHQDHRSTSCTALRSTATASSLPEFGEATDGVGTVAEPFGAAALPLLIVPRARRFFRPGLEALTAGAAAGAAFGNGVGVLDVFRSRTRM